MHNIFLDSHTNFAIFTKPEYQKQIAKSFYDLNIEKYNESLFQTSELELQRQGQQKALNLFHSAANHVPAYKDYLAKHSIKPESVKTYADFQKLPLTDKENYISKYSIKELSWHGTLAHQHLVSFSSGSTGSPYFWPRGTYQDFEGAFAFEHLLTYLFKIQNYSTLIVNCFSMGNYVAGTYVLTSIKLLAQKGYPLTLISPGINYQDTFKMLTKLVDQFDQIILCGYPPFLRDLLELAPENGIDFSKTKVKFFFASEFFSESWRDNTLEMVGNKNPLTDSTNIYGTADSAIFSFETPTTIMLRKLAQQSEKLNYDLFNTNLTPTLTQFNPAITFFESYKGVLVLTSASGIPLIRYNLKDQGNLLSNNRIDQILNEHNLNFDQQLKEYNIWETRHNLPYVYLTNRTDGSVSFYAITIYPEYIRNGLDAPEISDLVSGKFSLKSTHNQNHQPKLEIHVELKNGHLPSKENLKIITQYITESLKKFSSEYSFLEKSIGHRAKPIIKLYRKGESDYFAIGIKQKWIIN